MSDLASPTVRGRVLRVSGRMHLVQAGDTVWQCAARGRLKNGARRTSAQVFVGDWVDVTPTGHGAGVIEEIHPRRTIFSRAASGSRRDEQVMAVNLDQLVVVVAIHEPEYRVGFVDRAIVMAIKGGMRPVVCVNKVDLAVADEHRRISAVYASLGYSVFCTSALSEIGVDALHSALLGRCSGVVGQSGVGKTSLLNCMEPGLGLRTQELMRRHDRGRHTTTAAQLFALRGGGLLADTPGIKELRLWDVDRRTLAEYFVEMQPLLGTCRFRDCSHLHESGCAVRAATEAGAVSPLRYAGYRRIMESL